MNGTTTATPQPRSGPGCCGIGCASLFALIIFFAVAFVGGGYWAVRHYGNAYTSAEPMTLPESDFTSEQAAPVAPPPPVPGTSSSVPPLRSEAREVEKRWKTFEKAADREERARIELTAGEINALLQGSRNTRGKVYVSIDGNVGRVRFSVPLKDVPLMKGRYVNGEVEVRSSPDGDPAKAQISNVVLANRSVSDGLVDQRFFGWPSLRETALSWLNKQNIETFRIENNRVIGETRGQ